MFLGVAYVSTSRRFQALDLWSQSSHKGSAEFLLQSGPTRWLSNLKLKRSLTVLGPDFRII